MFYAALLTFGSTVIKAAFTLELGQFALFYVAWASVELVRVTHLLPCRFNFNKVRGFNVGFGFGCGTEFFE
jgi:hypothetical protein